MTGLELNKWQIDAKAIALLAEVQAEEIECKECTLKCINTVSFKTIKFEAEKVAFKNCIFPTNDIKTILNWILTFVRK